MLHVTAYVGYQRPVIKQALDHLRKTHNVLTGFIEYTASDIEEHAVFATSKGNYPEKFLETLFATTPEECAHRLEVIQLREYDVTPLALRSAHLILLKEPPKLQYAGEMLEQFKIALNDACGFSAHKQNTRLSRAYQRQVEEIAAAKARRRKRIIEELDL